MEAAATAQTPAAAAKPRSLWSTRLIDPAGNSLEVRLEHRRSGSWRVSAYYTKGTGKSAAHSRGASSSHAEERAARAASDLLVATALKGGWTKKESVARAARPDAFTVAALPKPAAKK